METQTLQSTVLDADKIEQLEAEIEQEMQQLLNSVNIRTLLEKYGVAGENVIKMQLQCEIELSQNQSNSNVDNQTEQTLVADYRPSNVIRLQCCRDEYGNCIKC
jgi:uncharacterized membrane protein YheB (UPF0754 family)